jgi:hypothetical protein
VDFLEDNLRVATARWSSACLELAAVASRPLLIWLPAYTAFRLTGEAYADALRALGTRDPADPAATMRHLLSPRDEAE